MARGIDHLVLAVRDLDRAVDLYTRMGFTLTPRAEHPWGTANRLVQLDGCYLELLAVADPDRVAEPAEGHFSFGAFARDFLAEREGFAMLALETSDARADLRTYRQARMETFAPFDFSRTGRLADGGEATFSFTLGFVRDPLAPGIGFFTCERRTTAPFYQPRYQSHENGALTVAEVAMIAPRPADHANFLSGLTGVPRPDASANAVRITTPRGRICVLTPEEARRSWGDALQPSISEPHLAAFVVRVADLTGVGAALKRAGIQFEERQSRIVIGAKIGLGMAIGFEAAGHIAAAGCR